MKTHTIIVQNLKCGGCANTITTKLSELKEVTNVKVNVEESEITFDALDTDLEIVKTKLAKMGYPAEDENNSTMQKAKSYVSCMVGKVNQ